MSDSSRRRVRHRAGTHASRPADPTRVVLRRRRCSEPSAPGSTRRRGGDASRGKLLLAALVVLGAGPLWAVGGVVARHYHGEVARLVQQTRAHLDGTAPSRPFPQAAPATSHGGGSALASARGSWTSSGATPATASIPAATSHPSAYRTASAPAAEFRAAEPMTFARLAPAGIAPRRSAAASGARPRAVGQTLYVDSTDPQATNEAYAGPTYTVPAGTTAFDALYVGYNGTGAVTHATGTLNVSGSFYLAANANSTGNYTLSGGTLSTGEALIGFQGAGTFKMTGGTFTTNGQPLFVGGYAGSSETFTLGGGMLSTGDAVIGSLITNTFTQTAGAFNTNGNTLYIGESKGSNGTYTMSGGTLTTGVTQVGDDGTGLFTQSGSSVHTTGTLLVGNGADANGTYALNGGTLNAGTVTNGGGTGTFNFNGGTLQAGASSTSFMQGLTAANVQAGGAIIDTNGFDVTVAQSLVHSTALGASLDGGLTKNGAGTLTLTGTNTYTGPTAVNAGTLAITGGTTGVANSHGNLVVNGTGTGTSAAALTLSGGTLNVSMTDVGVGATGAMTQSGGTFSGSNSFTLGFSTGSTGRYALSGGSFVNQGNVYVGDNGTGIVTQTGGSFVTGSGNVLALGFDSTGVGTYNLSGANSLLSTASAFVDSDGTGTFTQSGGTFTTNNGAIIFGTSATSNGTYHLDGGTLQTGSVQQSDGTGTFHFNGGTLQAAGNNTAFMQGLTTADVQAGGAVIDTNGFNVTVAQLLQHDATLGATLDGGLTKQGAGTLTLAANNTYTGTTDVRAGALMVTNVPVKGIGSGTGSGSVFVEPGAWLGGTGAIGGDVIVGSAPMIAPPPSAVQPRFVAAAGTLTPGVNGAGRLTINGNLTLLGGVSNVELDLAGTSPGKGYDQVDVGGSLSLGGKLTLTLATGFAPTVGEKFFIFDLTGGGTVTGTFDGVAQGETVTDSAGDAFVVNYADNAGDGLMNNDVSLTFVPEPGVEGWLGLGAFSVAVFLLARRIRGA